MSTDDWLVSQFEAHRARLRGVAYRMLGTASEAEDAVQEAWMPGGKLFAAFVLKFANDKIASVRALSYGTWSVIGAFEIVWAVCLVVPGLFRFMPVFVPVAAGCLAAEMLLVSALHVHYFGWALRVENPAMWTIMLAILSAFIAYGRLALKPL